MKKYGLLLGTVLCLTLTGCARTTDDGQSSMEQEAGVEATTVQEPAYTVHTDTAALDESHRISENLFGIFLEDINYAVDGGMYPEMVKNRSFEYGMEARDAQYHGWKVTDDSVEFQVVDGSQESTEDTEAEKTDHLEKRPGTALHEANPHYAVVTNPGLSSAKPYAGIYNSGYIEGMAIQEGMEYHVSFYAMKKAFTAGRIP